MIPILKRKNRSWSKAMTYTVQVPIEKDPGFGNETIEWLVNRGFVIHRDFDFDMNGGLLGYCSFFFKSKKTAIWTAMVWT